MQKQFRKPNGNLTILVVVSIGLIIAVGVIGFIFNSFLFQRTRAQYQVDAVAMEMASKINVGDRVGLMNELEERNRELIYVSRIRSEKIAENDLAFLTPLCNQLLDEDRSSHSLVESERKNQIALITHELQAEAQRYNETRNPNSTFSLRWLRTHEPRIVEVDLGSIVNVDSNVHDNEILDELAEFDRSQNYIDAPTGLFKANTNAKLPQSDQDLNFELAALPAYIGNTCAPLRNANPSVFVSSGTIFADGHAVPTAIHQIPSVVQLICSIDVAVGSSQVKTSKVQLTAVGAASGAYLEH